MSPDEAVRLAHIVEAARLIESYLSGVSQEALAADSLRQDAIIRRIQIIGEATRHLSVETLSKIPGFEAQKARGMRNVLVHDYDGINVELVWKTASEKIPALRKAVETYLKQ